MQSCKIKGTSSTSCAQSRIARTSSIILTRPRAWSKFSSWMTQMSGESVSKSSIPGMTRQGLRVNRMLGRGKAKTVKNGLVIFLRAQSVPSSPPKREKPYEEPLPWRDIGEANLDESHLYANRASDPECPVVQKQAMDKADQQKYMVWIEQVLDLDRRTTKDDRLYCGYCDMNNHPSL